MPRSARRANRLCSAVALALFYVLSASADELAGNVVRVADGDTITVLGPGNKQHKIRLTGIDAPEKGQAFGNASRESLASMVAGIQSAFRSPMMAMARNIPTPKTIQSVIRARAVRS